MSDVNISKFRASVNRPGSTPASPGFVVSEGQNPVEPSGTSQDHLPVTIAPVSTALAITDSQILSGAGTVGQYIRGDGSLADFPESSGGGSSVSYYLNGSVSQGTIGGVAYKELNKVPILGAGTDFTINANGYIASFITDAGDPNLLEIPGGNWNFETFFSANNGGGSPTFYVELYKYNGTTFTLIASNSTFPELIAFGTNVTAYFSTLAVPTTTLALTDRLAIRYYVTHSGRTIKLHTEDNHLCQIITTFTTGITALNGLTAQVQNFAVGTSGTDFAISSATATHTFNLPTASATNRGALSSADWSTFNNKMPAITFNAPLFIASGGSVGITQASGSVNGFLSSTDWTTFNGKENAITAGTTAQYFRGDKTFQTLNTAIVPELTNLYYTEARVNANTNVAANTAARHNAVTLGTANGLSLSTQVLSLGLASAGVTGALSGTDWTTFNNKQNALTNPVTGTGTTNRLPKFTGSTTIGDSVISDNTNEVTINKRVFVNNSVHSISFQPNNSGVSNRIESTNLPLEIITAGASLILAAGGVSPQISLASTGVVTLSNLAGSGTRMVVANASGVLSTQTIAANQVTGTGTTNYLPKFTGASTIGNSLVFDNGTNVGIGTTSPGRQLEVYSATSDTRIAITNTTSTSGAAKGFELLLAGSDAYAFNYVNGAMIFGTNSAERMRITSSGNVLIGTTSDNGARLQVSGAATFSSSVRAGGLLIGDDRLYMPGNHPIANWFSSSLTIGYSSSNSYGWVNGATNLVLGTDGNERMRITSGGNVLIGTTTDFGVRLAVSGNAHITNSDARLRGGDVSGRFVFGNSDTTSYLVTNGSSNGNSINVVTNSFISFNSGASYAEAMRINPSGELIVGKSSFVPDSLRIDGNGIVSNARTGTGTNSHFNFFNGNGLVGTITTSGSSTLYNTTSDYRLKEDLKEINGLEKVLALKVYDYKWKSDKSRMDGVLAHELAEVLPYAVNGEKDGIQMQSVDYSKIVPILIQSIKELKQEIDTLKN